MLAHRLRRWPNIKSALDQHIVFAGLPLILTYSRNITLIAAGIIMVDILCFIITIIIIFRLKVRSVFNPCSAMTQFASLDYQKYLHCW